MNDECSCDDWAALGALRAAEWDYGVGGIQCEGCHRTTICREFEWAGAAGFLSDESAWFCRACWSADAAANPPAPVPEGQQK
jgi:hypothetical protein